MTTDEIMTLADEYATLCMTQQYNSSDASEKFAALRAAVEQIVRERDELRALLREARKELEAPSTPYSRRIVIARIDTALKEGR